MPSLATVLITAGLWTILATGIGLLLGRAIRTSHPPPQTAETTSIPANPENTV
ncbi:hypothetical protein [Streptomyces sp. NPDC047803]|uniref:hypothetical protein n=1 Tax=Streptomyces TaxID=1883 RepID=UPI0033CF90C9